MNNILIIHVRFPREDFDVIIILGYHTWGSGEETKTNKKTKNVFHNTSMRSMIFRSFYTIAMLNWIKLHKKKKLRSRAIRCNFMFFEIDQPNRTNRKLPSFYLDLVVQQNFSIIKKKKNQIKCDDDKTRLGTSFSYLR